MQTRLLGEILAKCDHVTVLNVPNGCALIFQLDAEEMTVEDYENFLRVIKKELAPLGIKALIIDDSRVKMHVVRPTARRSA